MQLNLSHGNRLGFYVCPCHFVQIFGEKQMRLALKSKTNSGTGQFIKWYVLSVDNGKGAQGSFLKCQTCSVFWLKHWLFSLNISQNFLHCTLKIYAFHHVCVLSQFKKAPQLFCFFQNGSFFFPLES